jgi:GH15 family glucan-1,4-alpha-glucosidase
VTQGARLDGYAPIEGYAALGDGRTVALVATDGRVDWWPFPTLDAPPVCAAILDPERGGYFQLRPKGAYEARRRYLKGSNVLETTFSTSEGSVAVTQALNAGTAGRLPWTEFVHRAVGLNGEVTMQWEWRPGDRFGHASPWVRLDQGAPVSLVGDQLVSVICDDWQQLEIFSDRVSAEFTTMQGQRATIALVGSDHEPLFLPDLHSVDERLDRTISSWRRWSALLKPAGPWSDVVMRSVLAIKVLMAEDSGAIAAAATTSLPERIGGDKNWDYRYAWIRDSSFTIDALINLGLNEEVHRAVSWLLSAVRRLGPTLNVLYTLEGETSKGEEDHDDVPGYRRSRPVRSGNRAATQSQLGTYGDMFDTIFRYCAEGHCLDAATSRLLAEMADHCCDCWRSRDSGMWELPDLEHYTISKIGCWVALDRAVRLAQNGQIVDGHVARWRSEAESIRSWVDANCWSDSKSSYTFFAGTEDLDAATLLAGRTGFERGDRLAGTIRAIKCELGRGEFIHRYSAAREEEGAFVACTFWMVEALVYTGEYEQAVSLMRQGMEMANDVGLLAEQIDVSSRSFLGNFPQGLSHLSLINAAFTLVRHSRGEEIRSPISCHGGGSQ